MRSGSFSILQLCIGIFLLLTLTQTKAINRPERKVALPSTLSHSEATKGGLTRSSFLKACGRSVLVVRGGSDDEDEEITGVDPSSVVNILHSISKKALSLLGKVTVSTAKAFQRAIQAGLEGEEEVEEDSGPDGVSTRILKLIKRMMKAAFIIGTEDKETVINLSKVRRVEESEDEEQETKVSTENENSEQAFATTALRSDFGTFLSKSYGIPDQRDESGPAVVGGTLGDALGLARSQARLLVVFTPMSRPGKRNQGTKDELAIASILSSEVAMIANKRARKSGEETGSFLFWGAKAGSSEATSAIKRLKAKTTSSKGDKRPVLLVIYPGQTIDSSGAPKFVPKVLAQHHCSPPPSASLMAAWLNTLRKRHGKQYTVMQTELKEVQYYKERKEGYRESVQSDIERKEKEEVEEAKRLAKEKIEAERIEAIERRREELKAALPDEDTSTGAKKIAIRFADGRSGQRRFAPDQPVGDLFNWVDAIYEIEREKVILTTMNGKQFFEWNDESNSKTLDEAGLGRMAGFRVSEKKEELDDETDDDTSQ